MPRRISLCTQWRLMLVAFSVLLLQTTQGFSFASAAQNRDDGAPHTTHSSCQLQFADSYFASIATTMPIAEHYPPLAQTGHLYVDDTTGAVRIDQFFRNHRTTFLLDNNKLRGFLFFGERDFQQTSPSPPAEPAADDAAEREGREAEQDGDGDNSSDNDAPRQSCHVFYLPRKVSPFCVPQTYRANAQPSLVRGVPATRYTGMEGYPGMPLIEQNLYVLNTSLTDSLREDSNVHGGAPQALSFTPWRLEYRARPDLEPHKIAAAPYTMPNWRFFGHPMFDELTLSSAQETQLQLWQPAADLMTIDFYDYYATEHPAGTFAVPPQCTAVLRRDASAEPQSGRGGGRGRRHRAGRDDSDEEEDTDGKAREGGEEGVLPRLQLATIQRFLLQWHLLKNMSALTLAGQ